MRHAAERTLCLAITVALLAGCQRNSQQSAAPVAPAPQAAAPAPQSLPPPPPEPPRGPSLAMVPLDQRDFTMEAIQAAKKRVEQNPKDAEALEFLGNGNVMIQRLDKAQEYYQKALEADPKRATTRLGLANVLVMLNKPDAALDELNRLLKAEKDYPPALFNLGLIRLNSKGDPAGAKTAWTQLVTAHPENELAKEAKVQLDTMK